MEETEIGVVQMPARESSPGKEETKNPIASSVPTPALENASSSRADSNATTIVTTTKIVPNPSDNSFSRVILTDWLVFSGRGENPKPEIVE